MVNSSRARSNSGFPDGVMNRRADIPGCLRTLLLEAERCLGVVGMGLQRKRPGRGQYLKKEAKLLAIPFTKEQVRVRAMQASSGVRTPCVGQSMTALGFVGYAPIQSSAQAQCHPSQF
jgi:hypothetical protein